MHERRNPLLCELHAHTTWSDGSLTLDELVDLYGSRGFDVLCVTDHVIRADDPWHQQGPRVVDAARHGAYVEAVERAAARARGRYDLLLLPGLELTYDDPDPRLGAHAVAVGLWEHVDVDGGLVRALQAARAAGAALIAAHPYLLEDADGLRRTARWSLEWPVLGPLVDRFELFNRGECFRWVADAGLPAVACGDFHRPEHAATWKTLLPCAKDERAIVAYLRSRRPAYLVDLSGPRPALHAAA